MATRCAGYYGVCDRCGDSDDSTRPTPEEAKARMWRGDDGALLCWDCLEKEGVSI